MEFWDVLKNRHSIRSFQEKKIEKEKIRKILLAANGAPSAGNLQGYEIFLVEDKEIKEKLTEAAWGSDFITQAPVVLVFFANRERSGIKYGSRGENLYSLQDATIAASFAWLAAVNLGLSTVWVGAFEDEEVKQILGVKEDWQPVAILPLGYAAESPMAKPRRPLSNLVHKVEDHF